MSAIMKLFDQKCYELAEYFLPPEATTEQKNSLAYEIQDAVEDWLSEQRDSHPVVEDAP